MSGIAKSIVTVTSEQIDKAERLLYGLKGGAEKAMTRSLNRSIDSVRSESVRKVREEYTVKAGEVRQNMRIVRAKPGSLQAEMIASGSPLPLSNFQHNPKTVNGKRRSPVRVGVKKGSKERINNGFVARTQSGHKGVFVRVGKARLPIKELHGPSVPQMIGNQNVLDSITRIAQDTMDKRLDHEIERILNGASR